MSFENERYVSNRVDRITHMEEVIQNQQKIIESLQRSIKAKDKLYEELMEAYLILRKKYAGDR